ncbi:MULTISPECIES: DUF2059 domain-containing protein [unclassified Mesorhizobium]|uniref:DUF2059 domain-containing protein n=1 Tax=unclassified Mesorhizobium TaxID=325217 RepID=UPI003334ACC8
MTSFLVPTTRAVLIVYALLLGLVAGTVAAPAQTIGEINRANGLHEMLMGIGPSIANGINSIPGPLSKNFQEAWSEAMEGSFDAAKMETAVESHMADKLTAADLSDLAAFYASALGKRVTALEIQSSGSEGKERKRTDGHRILAELPSKDPVRLELYRKIMDDISAVDTGEAMALNIGYAMFSGVVGAAGKPLPDDQIMALVHRQYASIRQKIEQNVMEGAAYTYRDLPLEDLKLYSTFLASPAGSRYYDQMLAALSAVIAGEARSFGHRLFVALGYGKA